MKNARKAGIPRPETSAPIIALLSTARSFHVHLSRTLSRFHLTEDQFATLLVLHSRDPGLVELGVLARAAELSPDSARISLAALAGDKHVVVVPSLHFDPGSGLGLREPSPRYLLTVEGRALVVSLMRSLFDLFDYCARGLATRERYVLAQTCVHVRSRLSAALRAEPS